VEGGKRCGDDDNDGRVTAEQNPHRPPRLPEQSSGLADGMSDDGAGYLVITFYNSRVLAVKESPGYAICMNHFGSRVLDWGNVE
jgi:hypothetical protein